MKLFYSPGACSIGIHVLLEVINIPYETVQVDVKEGQQFADSYVALTPKSKVPLLQRDDGSVLSEFPAIAFWLAKSNPSKNLIGSGLDTEVRALEMTEYAVSTVHMQRFTRILRPMKFTANEEDYPAVVATGREIAAKAFNNISKIIGGNQFVLGDILTIADCALFYVLFWACDRTKMEVPETCKAYYARMRARPSVHKVLADEGIVLS